MKSYGFHKKLNKAREIYGAATGRPQDKDDQMMARLRRRNFTSPPSRSTEYGNEIPFDYRSKIEEAIQSMKKVQQLPRGNFPRKYLFINNPQLFQKVLHEYEFLLGPIALDLEFHITYSYDGIKST